MIYRKNIKLMTVTLGLVLLAGCQAQPSKNYEIPSLGGTQGVHNPSPAPAKPSTQQMSLTQAIQSKSFTQALGIIATENPHPVSADLQSILAAGDYKGCATLTDPKNLATCETMLITNKALLARNESMCDLATVESVRLQCHSDFKLPFFKVK